MSLIKYGKSECNDFGKENEWDGLWSEEDGWNGLGSEKSKMKYDHWS